MRFVARMERSAMRGLCFSRNTPDYASLHPGYAQLRHRGFPAGDGLAHLEALELGMLEIERAGRLVAGARVRGTERVRLGPGLERRMALPDRVRGVERVVLGLRTLEQM